MKELKLLDWEYETINGQYMAPHTLKYLNEQLGVAANEQELDVVYRALEIYDFILAYNNNTFILLDSNMYENGVTKIINNFTTFSEVFEDAWSLVELRQDEVYDAYQNGCISECSYTEQVTALEKLEDLFKKVSVPHKEEELRRYYTMFRAV